MKGKKTKGKKGGGVVTVGQTGKAKGKGKNRKGQKIAQKMKQERT